MKFKNRILIKLIFGITFLLFLIPKSSIGQNCPTFRIKEIKNVEGDTGSGSVIITINGSKLYKTENFDIRQKDNQVTGPIGYNVVMKITRDELFVSGLKKSKELYLKEYVILFSDESCKNSEIVEVGIFEIK